MRRLIEEAQPREAEREIYMLAYLVRVRALLRSIGALCAANVHDATGTLYRTLFETWLHGAYLALGDESALQDLLKQRDYEWTRLDNVFGKKEAPSPGERLSVQDLATRLGNRIGELDPEHGGWPSTAYDNHYRITSFHDAHGHLACVGLYVDSSGYVGFERDLNAAHHLFAVAISLGISLTSAVASAMDMDQDELAVIHEAALPVYASLPDSPQS